MVGMVGVVVRMVGVGVAGWGGAHFGWGVGVAVFGGLGGGWMDGGVGVGVGVASRGGACCAIWVGLGLGFLFVAMWGCGVWGLLGRLCGGGKGRMVGWGWGWGWLVRG